MSDIEIAQSVIPEKIEKIAEKAGIPEQALERYGNYKAKIDPDGIRKREGRGKLILVTAMTPTPAGEGKTTTAIGLHDGLRLLGKDSIVVLREPSLGPVFGVKGGAAGGGWAQVIPMEDINLHFTGDFHAVTAANNLLAAMTDNHIYQGNALNIDPRRITWKRVLDMNDRQLRNIVSGLNGKANGVPREDGFDITAASEIMAILCLAADLPDLKKRLASIVVGYTYSGEPVTAGQLHAEGAMAALLKDAVKPNLVQTLEHNPAIIHGGPFANIAHGCNSIIATKTGMSLCEYTVTEAGFGSDLGAEKFLDIKCRTAGIAPDAVVIVASMRALRFHGGADKKALNIPDAAAVGRGVANLIRHVDNMKNVFGLPVAVAMNRFPDDTPEELRIVREAVSALGVHTVDSDVWASGGKGGAALAEEVVRLCSEETADLHFAYELTDDVADKIKKVAAKVYRAGSVEFSAQAKKAMKEIAETGYARLPVCIAKTQYSFSDNAKSLGAPEDFVLSVKDLKLCAGAGFIVALTGEIMRMPGLPKVPAAENIDIDAEGNISGLF